MKLLPILLITFLFIQAIDEVKSASEAANPLSQEMSRVEIRKPGRLDCIKECKRRCRGSSQRNLCRRACRSCCRQCNCVPPGTYGNKAACPCYANLKTRGNRPKCP